MIIHPGKILLEEWIKPLNLSISEFALNVGIGRKNLSEIINGKTGISPAFALKLEKALGSRAEFWLDLQIQYSLWKARQSVDLSNVRVIGS